MPKVNKKQFLSNKTSLEGSRNIKKIFLKLINKTHNPQYVIGRVLLIFLICRIVLFNNTFLRIPAICPVLLAWAISYTFFIPTILLLLLLFFLILFTGIWNWVGSPYHCKIIFLLSTNGILICYAGIEMIHPSIYYKNFFQSDWS